MANDPLMMYPPFPATDDGRMMVDNGQVLDEFKRPLVASALPIGGGFRSISHNFCDKCTWWQESVEVVDQAATDSGDQLTYTVPDERLIDIRHGRLTFEDTVTETTVAPNGNTMTNILPTVKVDGVALDRANEDAQAGDDRYTIDYRDGSVTFAVARDPAEAITLSYRKGAGSTFTVVPATGAKMVIEDAEVDCSEDIGLSPLTPFVSIVHGSHTQVTGGAVVPVYMRQYKVFHDFHAAARRFWGPLPSGFGGAGGVASPKWTFEWQYARADVIYATPNYLDQNGQPSTVTLNKILSSIGGDVELAGTVMTISYFGKETVEGSI